ncbi:hypothetical protein [Sphingopyxis panaciterrae]
MRATSTPSPIRQGKTRLLESCAIAAGMAALALGGPALAQVAGTGAGVNAPGLSIPVISPPAPGAPANTTNVTTTGPQTIINWTPTDTAPAGAPIDFLPVGNTLNFYGTGQYTVLNRFISGGGAPLSRQIALNGTVNSYINTPAGVPNLQGGNIWFYNAGGILIGGGAAINVGSLVLTANDIDTAGGLFGPGGEIRFRGAAGTSEVQIAQGATISALTTGNPGGSYVALVAPRIVQRGRVSTDGSTAYVAAEQADIRINSGLFDINVLVGAENGDAITHTGITTGPAHQQGDVNQNRVYMVAIPKNDAVTMLVSGQVGYDDAAVAQVDPDGAVRLSAGYNIVNGEIAATPAGTGAGNITVNDIVFRSNTIAHASGAFVGQPISQLPGPFLPAVPPPQQGRILVQGDGTFIGDASATITVNPNRFVGATGNLIVQSGGANGVPGVTTVTVDGGQLAAGGSLSIRANGAIDAVTGDSRGGTASLTVSNGGTASAAGSVAVTANGTPGRDAATGAGGDGFGGNASITVTGASASGVASQVTGNGVTAQANGGGFEGDAGVFTPPDQGGNGTGGTATISVQDGGAMTAANGTVAASANGFGLIGNIQSGNGTGGTARIEIVGANSALNAAATTINANGSGGGSISDPIIGTFLSQVGGDGRGGSATFSIGGDTSTAFNPGDTSLSAGGTGGDAGGAENAAGGNAFGGTATVEATGLVTATFPSLAVNAGAESGGASSPSALTGLTGNATGGTINVTADNGAVLTVNSGLTLTAGGSVVLGENLGSGQGGNVTVSAEDEGAIAVSGTLAADVSAGSFGNGVAQSAGNGTGGTVNLLAANNGTLTAARYDIDARGQTANVLGANGPAQGGFVNVAASAGGQITGTDISLGSTIDASARSGVSANGSVAGGGTIQIVATGGGIDLNATTFLLAGGTSGGALNPASNSTGSGGVIQVQVVADPLDASAISFDTLQGNADGSTAVDIEAAPGIEQSAGEGQGGTMIIDVAGGTFAANAITVSASGYGGGVGTASGTGRGGTASYTQTAGTATVGDMAISANGFGGFAPDVAGQGLGGNATIDLLGGTLTGADVVASAVGVGGIGAAGNNFDPGVIVPSGAGGEGQGGTATVTINGAVVNTSTLSAIATGNGGTGGEFNTPFDTVPEAGGDGGGGIGGTAAINVSTGTLTTNGLTVDSTGIGGEGGNAFGSSSAGAPAGVGVGGNGGTGTGGSSTINLAAGVAAAGGITSASAGIGGNGGNGYLGGNGGLGTGGLAQLIVTGFDAGVLAVTVDTGAFGGSGGNGSNGNGGNGGDARGGTSRIQATGTEASAAIGDVNFITGGSGGAGDSGGIPLGATNPVAPRGGDGGTGEGGVLEVIASSGATIALDNGAGAAVVLGSRGTGGEGAPGSNAAYPDGSQGGDGGNGGGAIGGTVHLFADGGTITSSGNAVNISVDGTAGASGGGGNGTGTGAPGASGSSNGTTGGRVILESFGTPTQPGQISFGNTTIAANGDSAGRIGIYASGGNVAMTSLTAEALGTAPLTNLDTDVANSGIFVGIGGGSVTTSGATSLITGSSVGVYAQAGGTLAAGGDMTIQADDEVDIRHDFRTGTAPTIASGGALSITAASSIRAQTDSLLSAATSLSINTTAANGGVNLDGIESGTSTQIGAVNVVRIGSSTSGTDLTVDSFRVEIDNATAGDDINLAGNFLTLGTLTTDGTGADAGLDGSNIVLNSVAATTVTHAEADNDFVATVGSFQTGLNSIITGGDIVIASPGAVDIGNSTAGGSVSVDGQSIAFNTIDAGTTVGLNATGIVPGAAGISGGGIIAGGTVTLDALSIAIANSIQTSASLLATSTDGNVSIGSVDADGAVGITANGNITGSYSGGGNIVLSAAGDITASVNSTGGYVNPLDLISPPAEGFAIVNADGDATLTNSSAATMLGVRAGQAASVSNSTAGEDILVIGGTTATLANVTAGDDLGVNAPGGIIANNASTTGLGPDSRTFSYGPSAAGGGNVFQVATSAPDLSNIVLTATAGDIGASNIRAFDNLTATASGAVRTTETVRSGLSTTIAGSLLDLESVTAGTDITLTSTTGGMTVIGALSAGHDLTITSAAGGSFADLAAGDDIRIDAAGDVSIATLLTTAGGLDNEADNSGVYIDTPGDIAVTGATSAVGQVRLTAGGTVDTGAINADYTFIDAVGAVNAAGDIASGGMYVEGGSVALQNAQGNSGEIVLRATNGGVTVDGDVTTLASLLVEATGTIAVTGESRGGNYVQMTGGSLALADVNSSSFVSLRSTSGTATSTGTISAGTDVFIDTATGGQFNALVAGDDVSLNAGGNVTIASITAEGSNPQGEEIGSNVSGTVAGTLTVTGDTFAADDAGFDATTISLQNVTAGGSLTATAAGGPISITGADVGGNITLTSARAVTATGALESGLTTTIGGTSLDLQDIIAGTNVSLTATGGAVNMAGTIDAGRDIVITTTQGGTMGRLVAGDDIGITGSGNLAIAFMDATGDNPQGGETGSNIGIDVAGNVVVGHAEAAGDFTLNATSFRTGLNSIITGGDIDITTAGASDLGNSTAGGSITVDAQSIAFNALNAGTTVGLTANGTAGISGTDILAGGNIALEAEGGIQIGGNITSDTGDVGMLGQSNVAVNNVTAAGFVFISAEGEGTATALGTIRAGEFISIVGRRGITVNQLIADDTISFAANGDIRAVSMDAGTGILINIFGNLVVEQARAGTYFRLANNNLPDVNSQIGSLTAGTFIELGGGGIPDQGGGRFELGSASAGSYVTVNAQSLIFNSIAAGTTLDLASVEGIDGATIVAGGNIGMTGNSIAITGSVIGDAGFAANAAGGSAAVNNADLAGNISVVAAGNLAGTYVSGGDVFLNSGANITASATANGGYVDPVANAAAQGNLFVSAAGNATLTNSGAARMFGVNAGQGAAVTTATAGEDVLLVAGTTANLTGVTAGDDVNVRANGAITAQNVRTTGTGPDTRILGHSAAAGFTIGSGEGSQGINGADIVMASASGAINAGGLSAGDDILLNAATALTLNGAATLGFGTTGGDSSIRTQSASAVLGNLDAASDIVVGASGAIAVNTPSTAGRDILIDAASANIASLTNPAGDPVDTLVAGRDLSIETAGSIAGGAMRAGRDLTLSAGSTIDIARAATGAGGSLSLDAAAGITVAALDGGGATSLTSGDGAILIGNLASAGPVSAIGDSVAIDGSGNLIFAQLQANVGDARVTTGGNLAVTAATVAGEAELTAGGNMGVTQLDAANATLASNGAMTLGSVTADDTLATTTQSVLTVNGAVTGRTMSIASTDLVIGSAGRIGTAGTTEALEIRNIDDRAQTFVGGSGTQNGYHIDSTEMTRLYGSNIRILAPEVDRSGGRFIGTVPPDVVIDDFIMTAGTANSNLGTNGSLTIETPGTARVIGAVALTGMGDANALNILADQSLEVIMGEGSIRLSGTSDATPGGMLNLVSEDVIVATLTAIDDVASATTTDAINDRLAQNDGITSNDGALFAGGIDVGVSGGFYVQNSGTGTRFADRRGLTFGALGLNVNTAGLDTRIVINGVHLGSAGAVTGLNTIPLLTINGTASGQAPADAFDQRSTVNGCLIVATGACSIQELETSFPVQDVIEEEVDGDDDGDGNTLPQPLITMRDLDPLTGEPLLDDPVTGAGNDDLWTPPSE